MLDAVRKLNVTLLRWPGGNFSSNYTGRTASARATSGRPRLEMAWGTVESNRFGTHEFLKYIEMLGTEPYICANLGTGTWNDAQQWVEYCNSVGRHRHDPAAQEERPARTVEGDLLGPRQRDGWSLADGPSQRRRLRQVRAGSRQADEVDRSQHQADRRRLVELTDNGVDWIGWNRTVLEYLKHHADYLSLHIATSAIPATTSATFWRVRSTLRIAIKTAEGIIRCGALGRAAAAKIYIAWDEWNVWYRARGDAQRGRRILEERYNLEDALVVATFLNSFVNHAHIVKIANMAQLVNVIAPIFSRREGTVPADHLLSAAAVRQ